jgi:K+-transporting ATPase KdpF subunit
LRSATDVVAFVAFAVVSFGLLCYLVYVLIKPERF